MADNIGEAFQALGARWDAIFAREQARFAAVTHDLPMTFRDALEAYKENFRYAVSDMREDREWRDWSHEQALMDAGPDAGELVHPGWQADTVAVPEIWGEDESRPGAYFGRNDSEIGPEVYGAGLSTKFADLEDHVEQIQAPAQSQGPQRTQGMSF